MTVSDQLDVRDRWSRLYEAASTSYRGKLLVDPIELMELIEETRENAKLLPIAEKLLEEREKLKVQLEVAQGCVACRLGLTHLICGGGPVE